MPTDHRDRLAAIKGFEELIAYLGEEMGWPIDSTDFEELTFEYTPEELGIDAKNAAKIQEIKRLRPLSPEQPWGIFFVKFEPKRLPVVALRRILGQVALKKRASANSAERAAWAADDLLFVSSYGEGDEQQISFAHFSQPRDGHDLPTLKVLGWDNRDTALHLDGVARELTEHLAWPDDERDAEAWRARWRAAFTLRHREVITTSKELSIRLAALARDIRDRIKTALAIETDKGPLTQLMKAFQKALVHDLDADSFADMYAQTIAYGLLSACIADPHSKTADDFAANLRTNPLLRELMETFLKVGGRRGKAGEQGIDFDELGVSEVVELLDDANMEAVVRDFGDRNPQEDPVIHFYELFLKEYNAKKRMQRGVFYTPRPVVSYIVRSVDELLRTEFGLADGLADTTTWGEMVQRHKDMKIPEGVSPDQDFVQILDPACGTGTFLVEVIEIIYKTLVAKWQAQGHDEKEIDALWNEYVPKHLLTRLHGYELLMAPYAIAHLKIGLKLYETGYRFDSDERARVFLTNALEPAQDFSERFEFGIPALAHEARAVNEIKQSQRFTVIIGNPPYSHLSSNLTPEAMALVEPYKFVNGERIHERGALSFQKNLQDDYVKFIRLAEMSIERARTGLVGLISNNSYLDGRSFRGMRWHLNQSFRNGWVLDLHGSGKKNETVGDGTIRDENVFDIMQGVAICLWSRPALASAKDASVRRADLMGSREDKSLFLSNHAVASSPWKSIEVAPPFFLFIEQDVRLLQEYQRFDTMRDIFPVYTSGMKTHRDHFAYSFSDHETEAKLRDFCDLTIPDEDLRARYGLKDTNVWSLHTQRRKVELNDLVRAIRPAVYRPFDIRSTCFSDEVIELPRRAVMDQMDGVRNVALLCSQQQAEEGFRHVFCTRALSDCQSVSNRTRESTFAFPLWLNNAAPRTLARDELALAIGELPNVGSSWMRACGSPEGAFYTVYSLLHAPSYRARYAAFLRTDFPRLPLPGSAILREELSRLGAELVALHLMESNKLDRLVTSYTGPERPVVGRVGWFEDTVWLDAAATKSGQTAAPSGAGFHGVPAAVWNFQIGGYQVCHKWLKDRKGRRLSQDDIAHYHKIVVALSETIRLMKEIDEVIEQHGGWPAAFQTGEAKTAPAKVIPFRPRTVEPKPEERYKTCVPLVPLKAAAGAFSDPQHIEDGGCEWVAVESGHRLRPGMFVAQVVGKSMEPAIPDGAWCLFRTPVEGTRQGKTVLVQLRDATDPETGQRYTVKRYESEKAAEGDSWRHERITLKPVNPDFEPIVLTSSDAGELQVIAELVEVFGGES